MLESFKKKEAPKTKEAMAGETYAAGLTRLQEIVARNASEEAINEVREAIFQQVAKDLEVIQGVGEVQGNTWPRPGDDAGNADIDRFKPRQ